MGTFTLHGSFREHDGDAASTTKVEIYSNTQIRGVDGETIFEKATVPVVGGEFTVTLPANDNQPLDFGYTVRRQFGDTKKWLVPVQAPGATVELWSFTSTTPLPVPPGFDEQLDEVRERLDDLEDAPGGGVTDHGALDGLGDDDHPQYLNNARGDARYDALGAASTAQSAAIAAAAADATTKAGNAQTTATNAASSALSAHEADTTNVHGIADTSVLETTTGAQAKANAAQAAAIAASQPASVNLNAFAAKTAPSGAVVGTTDTQTLTNKTLTAPAISSPTGLVKGDVGLGNVDNTSDANKPVSTAQAAADTAVAAASVSKALVDAKGDLIVATANDTVTRLPVGSNDQVLTADSAQASGVKWASPAGGGGAVTPEAAVPLGSGNYVPLNQSGFNSTTSATIFSGAGLGRGAVIPFSFSRNVTPTVFAVEVTTLAASSFLRLGIYADSNGKPGALVNDYGQVSSATTGVKTWANAIAFTAGTTYWWLVVVQGAGHGTVQVRTSNGSPGVDIGDPVAATALSNIRMGYDVTVTGAMPANLTASALTGGVNNHVRVVAQIP